MQRIAYIVAALCYLSGEVGQGFQARQVARPVDVCEAVRKIKDSNVALRGTGRISEDGIVIFDLTCPVARNVKSKIPASVLIEIDHFDSPDDQKTYNEVKTAMVGSNSHNGLSAPFQILVKGNLTCPSPFKFRNSDDGEIVAGNGFGSYGLLRCKLTSATVQAFNSLD